MKQYPDILKARAQNLRATGATYHEICDKLGEKIPKATLSYWVKYITPPDSYQQKVAKMVQDHINRIHVLALAKNQIILKSRLDLIHNKNKSLLKIVDKNVGILLLSTLYWCEGGKYPSTQGIKFGNSDPNMIRLFLALLRRCYEIDESKFRLCVQCRADQDQYELTQFWQNLTGIQELQHYKPKVDPRSNGKKTLKKNYRGVCVIYYFDTNLQCELQFTGEFLGSIDSVNRMKNQIK